MVTVAEKIGKKHMTHAQGAAAELVASASRVFTGAAFRAHGWPGASQPVATRASGLPRRVCYRAQWLQNKIPEKTLSPLSTDA